MWSEARQGRYERLREKEEQGSLSEAERSELASLKQERCSTEEAAIRKATRRTEETTRALAAQLQRVSAQNQELETLIQEQEAYLAEVHALIADLQERRRNWRERYQRLTGQTLPGPVAPPPGG